MRPFFFSSCETLLGFHGDDRDDLAVLDELHLALLKSKEREVAATADIGAGVDLGAALANDDGSGLEKLTIISLDAKVLRVGIASVTG